MKVLAIDDSKTALMLLERSLRTAFPGTEVIKVQCPKDGIELAKTRQADLGFIFVDYNMAVMNGIQVVDEITNFFNVKQICLLTANTQSAIKFEAEKRGIHFLSKEFLTDELNLIFKELAK